MYTCYFIHIDMRSYSETLLYIIDRIVGSVILYSLIMFTSCFIHIDMRSYSVMLLCTIGTIM